MSEAAADDPELALALQLSVANSTKDSASQSDMSKLLADQSFVSSILASLPGVDPNDPSVKDLLASMQISLRRTSMVLEGQLTRKLSDCAVNQPQQKNEDEPPKEKEEEKK
ncbi:26S proteasome non-ATPase regulatory subunit 4-like protein [Sesbania bispinosa]|nr:26S proteasome non-ATPase regulatory subunit 4-like protein [Sesbania bispinosa]